MTITLTDSVGNEYKVWETKKGALKSNHCISDFEITREDFNDVHDLIKCELFDVAIDILCANSGLKLKQLNK